MNRYKLEVYEMRIEKFKELFEFDNGIDIKGIEKVLLIKPYDEEMFSLYVKYLYDTEYFEFANREFDESKLEELVK